MLRFFIFLNILFLLTGCYSPTHQKINEMAADLNKHEKLHINKLNEPFKEPPLMGNEVENYKKIRQKTLNEPKETKW